MTLTLAVDNEAVYFYMEPNHFADYLMTATDSSETVVSTVINGDHCASGVGFFESVAGGPYLTSISVTSSNATGEFGISQCGGIIGTIGQVPDGGATAMLLGLGFPQWSLAVALAAPNPNLCRSPFERLRRL